MRPPFAYYGGKTGMARLIASLLPPHRVYIEPFFGSGAVLFAKTPATHEIINDTDSAITNFFRCLRDHRDQLEAACALTPHARDEFTTADLDQADLTDIERARRFWVRVNQSFAKTAGTQTGFSITTARTQSVPASIAARLGRFEACARRLAAVSIENCDAADLITRLATPDAAIYLDPPYLASARRSARGGDACRDYRADMGAAADHERLAHVLHTTPATVILSGYHSPLYDQLYNDWPRIEISTTAAGNKLAPTRSARTEVLWSNQPINEGRLFALDMAVAR